MACEDSEKFSRLRLAYKKSRCSQLLSRFGRLIPKNRSRIRLQRVSEGAGSPNTPKKHELGAPQEKEIYVR
jgi:hypothetical protein